MLALYMDHNVPRPNCWNTVKIVDDDLSGTARLYLEGQGDR